jgi:hypothetical protein
MRASTGVTILGIASIACGVVELLWGSALAGFGGLGWVAGLVSFSQTVRAWGGGAFWGGVLGIIVGIAQMIIGVGVLGRERWAWLLAGIFAALSLIHPIVGLLSGNLWSVFGLIIPGIILYFLMQPEVRREFERAPV